MRFYLNRFKEGSKLGDRGTVVHGFSNISFNKTDDFLLLVTFKRIIYNSIL